MIILNCTDLNNKLLNIIYHIFLVLFKEECLLCKKKIFEYTEKEFYPQIIDHVHYRE